NPGAGSPTLSSPAAKAVVERAQRASDVPTNVFIEPPMQGAPSVSPGLNRCGMEFLPPRSISVYGGFRREGSPASKTAHVRADGPVHHLYDPAADPGPKRQSVRLRAPVSGADGRWRGGRHPRPGARPRSG